MFEELMPPMQTVDTLRLHGFSDMAPRICLVPAVPMMSFVFAFLVRVSIC